MEDYRRAAEAHTVDTVFIGGGTPTILPLEEMTRLIKAIKKNFNLTKKAEFTIEANPRDRGCALPEAAAPSAG